MLRPLILTLLFLPLVALAQFDRAAPQTLGAGNQPDFLPVEEAYQLAIDRESDGGLRLYWQIAPGYYLYQHRFEFALADGQGEVPAEVEWPPALERSDEYFGDVSVYYDSADILLLPARNLIGALELTVTSQGCADAGLCYPPRTQRFQIDADTGMATEVAPVAPSRNTAPAAPSTPATALTLPLMLLFAFLGGAILNLMPCVFPVLSLKVLGFASAGEHERHQQSLIYSAGVIVSFLVAAGVLIGLQQAGRAVGWGFQLQSPAFVIGLGYLFVVMGLSLSGVVQLGSSLMGVGSGLADRSGAVGSFFTGVLAVVVASPCTAPLMGTALGFAMTQPAWIGLSVFAALGAGMAAPMLLLSWSARARNWMPKPGAWMETLKQVLAFPLYATALWLFWVAGRQLGVNTMASALAGALLLAFGLWLWRPGLLPRSLAIASFVLAAMAASWRGEVTTDVGSREGTVAWSESALQQERQAGPVFVDVTADWCITCIANEQAVLYTDEIQQAFTERGVTYMVADWTNYDPAIADFLARHGRTGIPLYLLYPQGSVGEPVILPQLLRKSTVIEALSQLQPSPALASTP